MMVVLTVLRNTIKVLAAMGALFLYSSAAPAVEAAEVEWEVLKRLDTGSRPVDVAVSADSRSVFVLTEDGKVAIFGADGSAVGQIAVGSQAERIDVDPDGERLYVTNRQAKQIDVVQIDILREINLSGAPFKGPEKAPVVIAVFSDFQ
jgi:DNA-binding beta-propeller fold protein YncE